jgi:hypothetical protein
MGRRRKQYYNALKAVQKRKELGIQSEGFSGIAIRDEIAVKDVSLLPTSPKRVRV